MSDNNELITLVQSSGIEKSEGEKISQMLSVFFASADEWEKKIEIIQITDPSQTAEMKMAREGRLGLKNKRLECEKLIKGKREEVQAQMADFKLKDTLLLKSYQMIEAKFKHLETKLEEKEKFAERWESEQKEKRRQNRLAVIVPYSEFINPDFIDLAGMTDQAFNQMVAGAKLQLEKKIEYEKQAEIQRLEAERKNNLHNERKRKMNLLWNFTDISPDTFFGEITDEAFSEILSGAETKKAEHEAEQEKIRQDNERLRKEREEAEAKAQEERRKSEEALRKEREEKERLEAEIKAKAEQERKAKEDEEKRIAEEKRQKELAEKKALKAPDKEKLIQLANQFDSITMPELKTDDAKNILKNISELKTRLVNYITEKANTL